MMDRPGNADPLQRLQRSEEGRSFVSCHWKWAGHHPMLWLLVSLMAFGGLWLIFDFMRIPDSTRLPAQVLLSTLLVINAIWRATGALAAPMEMIYVLRRDEVSRGIRQSETGVGVDATN
jgi:hypothetical protein